MKKSILGLCLVLFSFNSHAGLKAWCEDNCSYYDKDQTNMCVLSCKFGEILDHENGVARVSDCRRMVKPDAPMEIKEACEKGINMYNVYN